MRKNNLRYASTERYMEGVITDISGVAISIDLKGRLGSMKLPLRMVITDDNLEVGQEVGFLMSFPEVLNSTKGEENNDC